MPFSNSLNNNKILHTNEWLIRRTMDAKVITVIAHRIPTLSVWGLTCKVNGQLVDHRQSDNPIDDACQLIDEHSQEL